MTRNGDRRSTLDLVESRFTLLVGRDSAAWLRAVDRADKNTKQPASVAFTGVFGNVLGGVELIDRGIEGVGRRAPTDTLNAAIDKFNATKNIAEDACKGH